MSPNRLQSQNERAYARGELQLRVPVPERGLFVSTEQPLIPAKDFGEASGLYAPIIAGIHAGSSRDQFLIVDTRKAREIDAPFLLVQDTSDFGAIDIFPDQLIEVGRSHHLESFEMTGFVSRDHFLLLCQEDKKGIVTFSIQDSSSENGTFVTGYTSERGRSATSLSYYAELQEAPQTEANYTIYIGDQLRRDTHYGEADDFAPYGYYRNHPIIGRSSPSVRNGVYGSPGSEAIVIDDKNRIIKQVIDRALAPFNSGHRGTQRQVLESINATVAQVLRYDLDETDALCRPHYGSQGLIELSEFVQAGVGVCRQQAVLNALIIEEAIERKILYGKVRVQRNYDSELNGAHAWALHTPHSYSGDKQMIVDAAQDFVGTYNEAKRDDQAWQYVVNQHA